MRITHSKNHNGNRIEVNWSSSLLQDYQNVIQSTHTGAGNRNTTTLSRSTTTQLFHLTMNVDAAVNWAANSYAIGGVVHDHEGRLMLAFGKIISRPPSTTYAELEAIKEGMQIAKDYRLEIKEINSDSLLAVQAVANSEANFSYVGLIANEVSILHGSYQSLQFNHVSRSKNVVAHSLASFAISSSSSFVWEPENFPFWLINLVMDDFN